MGRSGLNRRQWGRGLAAIVLALFLVAMGSQHTGRVVIDRSTSPPTSTVVGGTVGTVSLSGIALVSLICIFVSMWKRWDFEIVGWVILIVGVIVGVMH